MEGASSDAAVLAPPAGRADRERAIVGLIAEGRTNKDASAQRGIGAKTVDTHRYAILKNPGIGSVAELVLYTIKNKIIEA